MMYSKLNITVLKLAVGLAIVAAGGALKAQKPKENVDGRVTRATAFLKQSVGEGTAFCIRADGLFVTNWHVPKNLQLLDTVPLIINSGQGDKERQVDARLISTNRKWDLALLKVDGRKNWPFLKILPDDAKLQLRQTVIAYGFPFGTAIDGRNPTITVNQGRVSSLARDKNGVLSDVRFDAAINRGNSGGPLVDEQGRVIGVVTAKMPFPAERTSFAVGYKRLHEFLRQPGLGMHAKTSTWDDRAKPMKFEIRIITEFGAVHPDEIELELSADGKKKQVQTAQLPKGDDKIVIAAVPDPRKELMLVLRRGESSRPRPFERVRLADQVLHPQTGTRLSDVARFVRHPNDRAKVELRSGHVRYINVKDLPKADKILPAKNYFSSVVHIDDPRIGVIECAIRAKRKGKVLTEVTTAFPLAQRPLFAQFPGDKPVLDEEGPLKEFSMAVPLKGSMTLELGTFGPQTKTLDNTFQAIAFAKFARRTPGGEFSVAGDFSLMGPFVHVNGRQWHYATPPVSRLPSHFLPVSLKEGAWGCKVVRSWSAATKEKELGKDEVKIQHPTKKVTAVTIRSPKGKRAMYRLKFFVK